MMKSHRLIAFIAVPTVALLTQFAAAEQTYQKQDAVGAIEFDFPNISDAPFEPTEQWIDPLITKRFRFEGQAASAVLISTRIRPDLPADDSRLDDVQVRYKWLMQGAGVENFIERRFQTDAGDVVELIILNNSYDDVFPIGISVDQNATGLQTVGISQMLVREGRLIEFATHLSKQDGEEREALIARARAVCDAWRDSLKTHPAEPWDPPLPDPPEGYTWWLCPQTKTALRKPDGWHTKTTVQKGVFGYFVSKEDIEENGEYLTGLMVNVTPRADRRYNAPITQVVASYIQGKRKTGEVLEGPWHIDSDPFIAFGVLTKHKDPDKGNYVTHHLAIGNTQTGTLYITVFEAPAGEWEQAWKLGEPIIKLLILSPDI